MNTLIPIGVMWFLMAITIPHAKARSETLIDEAEAENGVLNGVVVSSGNAGFSGSGYVTGFDNDGDKVTVAMNVPEKGFYQLIIRYNGHYGEKTQSLLINGGSPNSLVFPASSTFRNLDAGSFLLEEGENTFTIQKDWGWTDIDRFELYSSERKQYHPSPALVDSEATRETKELYAFLLLQFGDRIISGQTHSYYDEVKNLANKSPMLRVGDFQHFTEGYPYLWANGGHTFGKHDDGSVDYLIDWYNNTGKKGIISYQWHWHSPAGGEVSTNTFYTNLTTFDVTRAVTEGTTEYDLIIRDIDDIAAELKKFADAGIPVLWRPLHEAGGAWFWWGAGGPEACLKLYDILFDRLKNIHQLHNLIWVWSTPEEDWYPGNEMVDIIGHDSYPGSYNYTPQKPAFDRLYTLTDGEKIIAMTENGPIPHPGDCLEQDAPWAYFMAWNNLVTEQNTNSHIQEVYNNPIVLTLESENFITEKTWRSTLYPENWTPGYRDEQGRFLHDFSYAGYHQGEKDIPDIGSDITNVTQAPYYADNTGIQNVTSIIQQALDDVGTAGGGVVYLPSGTYRIRPEEGVDYSLRIAHNNLILRGAGSDSTFLFNDEEDMRQKDVIRMQGDPSWWFTEHGILSEITADLLYPTRVIPVESVNGFNKGDLIIVRSDATEQFIKEHDMEGYWTESAIKGVAFLRTIDSICVDNNLLFIDSPTRYFLKIRDHARVYHAGPHLQESGIENLCIGNKQSLKTGWEEESYTEQGTGAYDAHASHAIRVTNSMNCWIKKVQSYHPEENPDDYHLLSNGILLNQCRNSTVDSCYFQKPQYEGGGGNGYMYTLSSNDCLIKNCRANHSRHNYDFKYPYSNGNVIHHCRGENSKYASDFHMYLSMSNLFDVFTVNSDYLESTFRPWGGNAIHGYSSTQSVFYNTIGEAYHPNRDYIVESKQFGWGYVIGTSGDAYKIVIEPTQGTTNGYAFNTAPPDFYEGMGNGENLRPWSLYLDQLDKRFKRDSLGKDFSVEIIVKEEHSGDPVEGCTVKVFQEQKKTGTTGQVFFGNIPDMLILTLEKAGYVPLVNEQISIFSDTTLTFFMQKKVYNVVFELLDKNSGQPIWFAYITVDGITKTTSSLGVAEFPVYEGACNFEVTHDAYLSQSGSVAIFSDTTFTWYLSLCSATVKFRLKKGSTPVNNAMVVLENDTTVTSALGISSYYNLPVDSVYHYHIYKTNYEPVEGEFLLLQDTTLDIQMVATAIHSGIPSNEPFLEAWPNPAGNVLNIKIKHNGLPGILTITDGTGKGYYNQSIEQETLLHVDTRTFPAGFYILRFLNKRESYSGIFIKDSPE